MGFKDTFHFDPHKYREESERLSNDDLIKKHHSKVATYSAACTGVAIGAGGAIFTHGISLIPAAYNLRQAVVRLLKLAIIEAVLEKRGQGPPRVRARDVGAGVLTSLAASAVGFAAGDALGSAAASSAGPHVGAVVAAAFEHPSQFFAGAYHGAGAVFHHNAGAHTPSSPQPQPYQMGTYAGAEAVKQGGEEGAEHFVGWVMQAAEKHMLGYKTSSPVQRPMSPPPRYQSPPPGYFSPPPQQHW
ncbi:hypothetical protein BV25DRAFT_1838176 [Artomyces pyxidatus]|uniref:Uncharacterized protein n=1 Tax=Artomyces pyxidatus TaxID=48021 RepID=A0ACB8T1R1_9AGAM|nr:hypothetical protein BV25DRAFT_1838176 [Artomyces pyxidatus]